MRYDVVTDLLIMIEN